MKESQLGDPSRVYCDSDFDGRAIEIDDLEVLASERLREDLGLICRPMTETMADMGRKLLRMIVEKKVAEYL